MVRDLDSTLGVLLKQGAVPGSELAQAKICFDLPDATWRGELSEIGHSINCYLYDVHENAELRSHEPLLQRQRSGDELRAVRRRAPVRIDCAYSITAWSPADKEAVLEEHRLLSQALVVLLKHPTIPREVLRGELANQIPPYPTVIAAPNGLEKHSELWSVLEHPVKPSLDYVVTLALMLDQPPAELPLAVEDVAVEVEHKALWDEQRLQEQRVAGRDR